MNDKLRQNIIMSLSALFNQARSNGIEQMDLLKVVEYINDTFRIQLDPSNMEDILNDIDIVSDINDDVITIAGKEESNEDEEAMDNVEDTASEQAYDNLTSESFVGKELDINKIKLNESMEDYFILKGAKDNNVNLICCNYDSSKRNLRCRLKDKSITVNINLKDL
jgi:hypothetical protein